MKRLLVILSLLAFATSVFAVPFASMIELDDTLVLVGSGTTINYFVNQAGGTATIEIVKASDSSVVATFSGTAALGANSVVWDGTVDNAGGADVPSDNYRVKITVAASAAAGWVQFASNNSVGGYVPAGNPGIYNTLFDGFSPMEWIITQDSNHDAFGYTMVSSAYTTPLHAGFVVFNPDLSCYDGGDGSTFWLNFPGTPSSNQSVWGVCFDPDDDEYVWVVGQDAAANVMYGKWNATTLTDVTNGATDLANSRDIVVVKEGSDKYAYICNGVAPANIWKCKIEGGVISSTTPPVNVMNLVDTNRYAVVTGRAVVVPAGEIEVAGIVEIQALDRKSVV